MSSLKTSVSTPSFSTSLVSTSSVSMFSISMSSISKSSVHLQSVCFQSVRLKLVRLKSVCRQSVHRQSVSQSVSTLVSQYVNQCLSKPSIITQDEVALLAYLALFLSATRQIYKGLFSLVASSNTGK